MSFLFPSSTITFDAALRDLARGTPRARAFAAHALGDVTEPAEKRRALEALLDALADDRFEVRAEACSSLGDLKEASAVPALIKRLEDPHGPVRQNAAIALGTIAHPDGYDPLAHALREGAPDLRFQAATSLAEIDPRRAFDALLAALHDKDSQVVGAAALALGAIPATADDADGSLRQRARTALVEELDHPNDGTRFDVAYALAELGDSAGRNVLVRTLGDTDRAWDAVTALTGLGGPDDIAALATALTNRATPPEATVYAAGSILRLGGNSDAARRVLLAGLAARKTHVRALAVEHLAEIGGDWAVAPLEKLARTGKGAEILELIAEALARIAGRQ
ncbi:MAG: HEAT repeat domain-containing protein [Kofleriaceae bacterium]